MRRAAPRVVLGVHALLACGRVLAAEESIHLVEGEGHDLTATTCATCHSLDYIAMNAPVMNRASWEKSVRKMIDKFGAPIKPADVDQIVAYLSEHYSG
jgi:cytochrome c5